VAMLLYLIGIYTGGFIYVGAIAASDPDCPDLKTAIMSALIWPYGLYEVVAHMGGGVGR
jgi:hypothetical protein